MKLIENTAMAQENLLILSWVMKLLIVEFGEQILTLLQCQVTEKILAKEC